MAFTMHSHSGQFCPGHAKDTLEAVVQRAVAVGFRTMGLTEHMPRTDAAELYPEELAEGDAAATLAALHTRHGAFLVEARRLRRAYAGKMQLLIGFEGEWIRPAYGSLVTQLAADPAVDYFIGSLHHIMGVPIDYSAEMYDDAMRRVAADQRKGSGAAGETPPYADADAAEAALWARYYDDQHAMLLALQPRVVGHVDLVRLLSRACRTRPGATAEAAATHRLHHVQLSDGTTVWARIERNLRAAHAYGAWLECNSAALRKGLAEPYPCREVAGAWVALGGRFTMSDDSHGVAQVATNYGRALDYLESLGVAEVWTLERRAGGEEEPAELVEKSVPLEEFRSSLRLD